jgi:SH3-like domain-containing protein
MQKKIILIFYFLFFNVNLYCSEDYFLTLRNEKVNLRQGPSFEYPIKLFYEKKYLPILITDKSGNFRKIKDHENNNGWIHISQLSKRKAAITIKEKLILFNSPTIYSKPLVVLEKGRLCLIIKCKEEWCKIKISNYKGWVKKKALWGRL